MILFTKTFLRFWNGNKLILGENYIIFDKIIWLYLMFQILMLHIFVKSIYYLFFIFLNTFIFKNFMFI
jgi:hypothetical protein